MPSATLAGRSRAILLVAGMLFLDLTTATGWIDWQWPVVSWQMYRKKTREEPLVRYRQLVAVASDGTRTPTSDCGSLSVLAYPYRMDSLLHQDLPRLLSTCLRELRHSQPTISAVALENRSWRYDKQSYADQLQHSPTDVYRVVAAPAQVPESLRRATPPGELIQNGDFEHLDPETGLVPGWVNPSNRQAIAVDLASASHFGVVPALRSGHPQSLVQNLVLPATSSPVRLVVSLLALASSAGATVRLDIPETSGARAEVPGDGGWHRIELVFDSAPRASNVPATLRLLNAGSADAFVDDVSLTLAPSQR